MFVLFLTPTPVSDSFVTIKTLTLGAIIALFVITFIVVITIGWKRWNEAYQSFVALAILLFITATIPLAGSLLKDKVTIQSQASKAIQIETVRVTPSSSTTFLLAVTLLDPASALIEVKDLASGETRTIVSSYGSQTRTDHTFVIKGVSPKGAEVTFILNGQKYFLDGKPLRIN